ncbi:hypothetical protein MNV49_005972 [Pseudohyphozyma bogoriensis]|nr:hypothetical protein MNV49_005972 [Pseudohyphozyma bogoriensis]
MHSTSVYFGLFLTTLYGFGSVAATFSQGTVNLTRDYEIQFDCVFSQPGPVIRAFCGGIAKSADGDWSDGGSITPYLSLDSPKTPLS